MSVRDLYARGDLSAAALREAEACDRDGFDVTAAILRGLVAERQQAIDALRRYGRHESPKCGEPLGCFCGLDDVLAELERVGR